MCIISGQLYNFSVVFQGMVPSHPWISQNLSYMADEAGLPGVHGGLAEPRSPVPKHVNYVQFWPRKQFSIRTNHFYTKFYRLTMNPPEFNFFGP